MNKALLTRINLGVYFLIGYNLNVYFLYFFKVEVRL